MRNSPYFRSQLCWKIRIYNDGLFKKGQFKGSLDEVKNYLKNYQNVFFYKGVFPETAGPIENSVFSFVNVDVDTYKSTLGCLEYFKERPASFSARSNFFLRCRAREK